MASLPYMQFYVADYLADTAHLDTVQHGAYMLLIMNYWQTGKPLPDNDKKLAAICRMSLREWKKHRAILQEFFKVEFGHWTHKRIENDLAAVHEKSELARAAGKKSAERRLNGRSTIVHTDAQRTLNHKDKDTDKDTDIDTELDTENVASENKNNVLSLTVDTPAVDSVDNVDNFEGEGAGEADFEAFCKVYPLRKRFGEAADAWNKALREGVSLADIVAAAHEYARHVRNKRLTVADISPPDVFIAEGIWRVYAPVRRAAGGDGFG